MMNLSKYLSYDTCTMIFSKVNELNIRIKFTSDDEISDIQMVFNRNGLSFGYHMPFTD